MEKGNLLIAMQANLGLGHKGEIIITTQKRVDENQPMIAKDIIDKDHAEHLVKCWNEYDELQKQSDLLTLGLLEEKRKTSKLIDVIDSVRKKLRTKRKHPLDIIPIENPDRLAKELEAAIAAERKE